MLKGGIETRSLVKMTNVMMWLNTRTGFDAFSRFRLCVSVSVSVCACAHTRTCEHVHVIIICIKIRVQIRKYRRETIKLRQKTLKWQGRFFFCCSLKVKINRVRLWVGVCVQTYLPFDKEKLETSYRGIH